MLAKGKRQNGVEVIGDVTGHRPGEAGHKSEEQLQRPEVKLNLESSVVQSQLPPGGESFHGFVWSGEEPALPFDMHVCFEWS